MKQTEWILCPVCGSKTRSRIREDTVLINYPLYCPKCRQERLIEVRNIQTIVITEPDTLDAEPMNISLHDFEYILELLKMLICNEDYTGICMMLN